MRNKFLTKKTKITIKEDSNYLTPPPTGLKTAEKVHDEDGKINKKALTDFAKKLEDYYGDELAAFDEPKVTGKDGVGSDGVDIYDIESLGAGSMLSLEYEAEGSEVEKKFKKRVDDLNDTSEYDKIFGTVDGFGETKEADKTYEKMKKASAEYNKYEDEYELPNPLRVKQVKKVKTESKDNKKKKMKRLNFKNEFNTEYEMLQLIPENYKKDGHTFLMTDGNKIYKVRWDKSLKEGTVLGFKNKSKINEGMAKMKKLYNYKYSDSMGKTNDYISESKAMRKMMNVVRGNNLIVEQQTISTGKPFGENKAFQEAMKLINKSIGLTDEMTVKEYLAGLTNEYNKINTDQWSNDVVQGMKKKYNWDYNTQKAVGNDIIKDLQQQLVGKTDFKTWSAKAGDTKKEFVDSAFGPATAKVLVLWLQDDYLDKYRVKVYEPETKMGSVFGHEGYDAITTKGKGKELMGRERAITTGSAENVPQKQA